MNDMKKCWRCLKEPWQRKPEDKDDQFKIITLHPHDCEDLEIKLRIPINICASCSYGLKLKLEFECRVYRTKKRLDKEEAWEKEPSK